MSAGREGEPFIPDEIMVSILNKLDVRDVARCRCVCRRWKDLTSDEYFVYSLGIHSAPMVFADFRGSKNHMNILLDKCWEAAPRRINYNFPVYIYGEGDNFCKLFAQGSQNGFIFFATSGVLSIINPINRDEVRIMLPKQPWETWTIILGIFLHPVSREYCTIWNVSNKLHGEEEYKMLNLGTHPCWRGIKNPFSKSMVLDGGRCAVFVKDFFYWKVRPYGTHFCDSYQSSFMAFDIKTEELSLLPLPHDCTNGYEWSHPFIHNAHGFLSIGKRKSDRVKMVVKIWTLKDREKTSWTSSEYVFNCVNNLNNFNLEQIIDEQVLFRLYGTTEFLLGNLKHGTLRKFVCNWKSGEFGWFHSFLFHKPSLASLKKSKPLIRLDQEFKEVKLSEFKRSSSTNLNIVMEDITDI